MKIAATIGAVLLLGAVPGFAADTSFVRVMTCKGPDAAMEIYEPDVHVFGEHDLPNVLDGFYVLDLSGAMKGKHLEPVRLVFSMDGKTMTVNQLTRGLPPTTIPMAGGTVDFDKRFGTHAVCGKFGR
jgi:hypothetical protein